MPPRFTNNEPIDDDAASLVSSHGSVTVTDFIQRANQMMADTKKRRDAKRNKIESDRAKRIKDVKKKLDTLYENRRTQRTKAQHAQWTQLHSLNKRRQEIETQILKTITNIERNTHSMARELNAVLQGRLSGFKDLANTQSAV